MQEQVLYSKWEQGAVPISVSADFERFEVRRPGEAPKVLTSKRQVMLDLYGGKDLHIPFDRYFKLGRYASVGGGTPALSIEEVFEILARGDLKLEPESEIVVDRGPKKLRAQRRGRAKVESSVVAVGPEPDLGIDLAKRGIEVAKLMYKGFGAEIQRAGYDPDDVLQEIYRGILSRNNGTCPYDPRKSSFSHYVYMVCRCVIKNIHRIEARRRGREFVGVRTYAQTNEGCHQEDVAESEKLEGRKPEDLGSQEVIEDFRRWLRSQPRGRSQVGKLASDIVPFLYHGYTIKEIAQVKEVHPHRISKAVKFLKSLNKNWNN